MRSGRTLVDFPIGWVRAYWNPFVIEYTLWIQAPLMWRLQSYLKIPNLIGKVQIYTTTSIVFLAEYLEWWICKEMMHLHSWNHAAQTLGRSGASLLGFCCDCEGPWSWDRIQQWDDCSLLLGSGEVLKHRSHRFRWMMWIIQVLANDVFVRIYFLFSA